MQFLASEVSAAYYSIYREDISCNIKNVLVTFSLHNLFRNTYFFRIFGLYLFVGAYITGLIRGLLFLDCNTISSAIGIGLP